MSSKQVIGRFGNKSRWVAGLSVLLIGGAAWISAPLAKSHDHAAPAQTAPLTAAQPPAAPASAGVAAAARLAGRAIQAASPLDRLGR